MPTQENHVACGHAGSRCEMTLNTKELVFGLLVSNLRMCYIENKNCFSWERVGLVIDGISHCC